MSKSMGSNLVDPFQGQSIMCLSARTFRDLTNVEKSKDLEAIHQQMVSMVLRSPFKVLEKAKLVIDGSSELLNTKENNANANNKENLQERRPALTRKRAQFSLKPDTSQPSTTLEPSFQIDQLQNPDDFYAAYEKFENTRKEMKRQRGGEDLNEVKISMDARRRRPEISRRKVSYKHHDYSTNSESAMLSSQEILQEDIRNPPTQDSEQESVILNDSQDENLAGPVTKKENRLNELFDELISSDIHRLDGNEALSLLKDRLKIKPVDIDNLDLPDFHDVGRFDFVSHGKNLLKDQNRLSGICTLPEGLISKTPGKQKEPSTSPHHLLSSPTPPRHPLLTTSTFGKRSPNSISVIDQLPACDIDSSPITRSLEITGGQLDHGSKGTEFPASGTFNLLAKDKVMSSPVVAVSPKMSTGAAVNSSQKSPHNKMHEPFGTRLAGAMIGLEDHDQCDMTVDKEMDADTDTRIQPNEGSSTEGNVEDIVQKAASSTQSNFYMEGYTDNVQLHIIGDIEENVEDEHQKARSSMSPEVNTEVSKEENLERNSCQPGIKSTEDNAAITTSQISDIDPENQHEHQPKPTINKKKKTSRRLPDLRKTRQSLADAGTSWTSGVRRSQRVRSRPLEYWKGERFLYGRVHNSLPTVIGLKYMPSNKNGKPDFKVESFVSNEHKELVDLVALH
ncbi:centromere protein C-like [Cynara cardunculus var. scolymus]|uniref:centromere protein C-like n=1 Tax=Cynara cardunculus var. scolymus TaxID=59895 RepID=UPI000D62D82F|nr:centromere protein C-like [Cynara cardunculus var. scolymus]